jgi:glutamate N-acetyltransferase / amino-acid N-acetyltransferase
VFVKLAQAIVKDGEGATRFVEIEVCGAADKDTARKLGRFVANSKLVKTAMFGQDPNWGRLVASLGACGYEFDSSLVDLYLDHQALVIAGQPADTSYDILKEIVQKPEYKIRFDLHSGNSKASVWTCDLSYEYVRINAEYTT